MQRWILTSRLPYRYLVPPTGWAALYLFFSLLLLFSPAERVPVRVVPVQTEQRYAPPGVAGDAEVFLRLTTVRTALAAPGRTIAFPPPGIRSAIQIALHDFAVRLCAKTAQQTRLASQRLLHSFCYRNYFPRTTRETDQLPLLG